MPKKLDPAIGEVLKRYGLGPEAAWDCHGRFVVYHWALEQIAAKAGVTFDPPVVLEANSSAKCAVLCVTGMLGERYEWSIGEASPANNKNSYPFAMAEKRAKDRVIIKLAGLHGLYSEEEADDFKAPPLPAPAESTSVSRPLDAAPPVKPGGIRERAAMSADAPPEMLEAAERPKRSTQEIMDGLAAGIQRRTTAQEAHLYCDTEAFKTQRAKLTPQQAATLAELYKAHVEQLRQAEGAAA